MTRSPLLSLVLALTAFAVPPSREINEAAIRAHVRFLASDALEGRGPASTGDTLAQQYIAAQFEAMGLKPGAPGGGWYQPFDLVSVNGSPKELSVAAGPKKLALKYSEDFIAVSGTQLEESKLDNAEVVFVGYGIVAPEYQWDDYKGVDMKGKVLLMMNNDPEDDPALFAGKARLWYGRWDYKYEIAAKVGAVGCIIIHTTPSAGYPWQVVQTSWSGEQFDLPYGSESRLQVKGWTTEDATKKLVALTGKSLDELRKAAQSREFQPVPLGIKLSTQFKNTVQKKKTANVMATLPGNDAKLKEEVVVYTAHHDHLGKLPGAKPGQDDIYNGALDNAAGVAALLSIARAYVALPAAPRRTVLFAAVAAEEQGLLGSQYLVEHPPVPVGRMAVNINIDGMNIWGQTRDVSVIGLGKSNVDTFITKLAKVQKRAVKPDELSDRGFFYRSDQFNFAKWGVPAAYFASGSDFIGRPPEWGKQQREEFEAKNYHQPSDELNDSWNLAGGLEDVQLYFQLGWEIGQAAKMPEWNKGDEFEAPRQKALAAVKATTQRP